MIGDGSVKVADLAWATPPMLEVEGKSPAHCCDLAVLLAAKMGRHEAAMSLRDPTVPQQSTWQGSRVDAGWCSRPNGLDSPSMRSPYQSSGWVRYQMSDTKWSVEHHVST